VTNHLGRGQLASIIRWPNVHRAQPSQFPLDVRSSPSGDSELIHQMLKVEVVPPAQLV